MKWWHFVLIPALLGLVVGYGVQRYRSGLIENEFEPYLSEAASGTVQERLAMGRAYTFIPEPQAREYGEIESFRRYEVSWTLRSVGLKTLNVEVVTATGDVTIDGEAKSSVSIRRDNESVIRLSWIENGEQPDFNHFIKLKTNDDVASRKEIELSVTGTVNPLLLLSPRALHFGPVPFGERKQLTSRVVCFSTSRFAIERTSLSEGFSDADYDVEIQPVETLEEINGRKPAVAYDIHVTAIGRETPLATPATLTLHANLEEVAGLQISLDRK